MDYAARDGHLDVIKWIHKTYKKSCTPQGWGWAIDYRRHDVVKWIHENCKYAYNFNIAKWALIKKHFNVVE
jgi:hypothetical protein